jgi:hypothetical protein
VGSRKNSQMMRSQHALFHPETLLLASNLEEIYYQLACSLLRDISGSKINDRDLTEVIFIIMGLCVV